jgi:hypothetical protein
MKRAVVIGCAWLLAVTATRAEALKIATCNVENYGRRTASHRRDFGRIIPNRRRQNRRCAR